MGGGGCSTKKGHWEYTSLKRNVDQTRNLHHGHFGDRDFEKLPYVKNAARTARVSMLELLALAPRAPEP